MSTERKTVQEYLSEARAVIESECNCNSPEYRALDALHCAIVEMREAVAHLVNAVEAHIQHHPSKGA